MSGTDPRPVGEDDLHGLIDGRLDPERRALVEAWLARRPEARARIAADREDRERLRAALAPVAAEPIPARLRVANLRAARRRSTGADRLRLAAGLALGLGLGAAGGWLGRGVTAPIAPVAGEPMTRDAMAAFRTFTVETVHPVEVTARDEPHLVQWLSRRLDQPLTVPDLSAQGFRLMGGRLVPTDGSPAALLMYADAAGLRLTLYGRAGPASGRTRFRYAQDGPIGAFAWSEGRLAYVVTARTDAARLLAVAEAVDAQVRAAGRPGP